MSVVVAYKFASNPQDASVDANGVIDFSRAKPSVSEYDPVAMTVGRTLAGSLGTEVVGVCVGTSAAGAKSARSNALAKGLDRAVIVADDATRSWNATHIARALASLAVANDAHIVLTGDASVDESAKMMSALIAGVLGWPAFQDIIGIDARDGGFTLTQNMEGGSRTIDVDGPVVISVDPNAAEPAAPSMKEILAAAKKPAEVLDHIDVEPVAFDVIGTSKPEPTPRKHLRFDSVSELATALRADGIL
ncbi:electron transfer flavoprotein subunit beta/FixA family protein [Arcanobacterium canis]|uniref:Electron transfer flavoprotein small subunit n=1 Tax=Arcanobacterium canis TaxID=999183 RepID=A0ABY8FZ66_9ACTO|nr:electron transfer flavoprotein beta subunit/FixA family protein [Arcanobacterium canis]WFM82860.1 electron transfer flavoprotein beta subunit/FixA family protein [Arcanobacterium canis]